jgi:hypothetical protein
MLAAAAVESRGPLFSCHRETRLLLLLLLLLLQGNIKALCSETIQ